jgi:phosphoribosylaminoimidazolecarboxamide formyltransferase/IMP cyclohydrolase
MKIRRALVSVYDKRGIVEFCQRLRGAGIEIVSTGGTARLLGDSGIEVVPVERLTGFPEMMDGRVKTLHPRIHGGILARRDQVGHLEDMERHEISPIDLVVVDLYPFAEVAARPDSSREEKIEMIDIGGPSLLRSAAKNHAHVGVVCHREDYDPVAAEIERDGELSEPTRQRLAVAAFQSTSAYDAAIAGNLRPAEPAHEDPPPRFHLDLERAYPLRYGENPHQVAAFYREAGALSGTVAGAEVLQGKQLSYNNLLDLDAAWALVAEFGGPAAALIKHHNPCGCALGPDVVTAYERARDTDPVSAFGCVAALNVEVDDEAAARILSGFVEAVAAPDFTPGARERFATKPNVRLARIAGRPPALAAGWDLRRIRGGLLVQSWDGGDAEAEWKVVTKRSPSDEERAALAFAWIVVRHVTSNAIVFTTADRTLGVGAGQMSRVDSVHLARTKARTSLAGSAVASDAFFPFRDGLDALHDAGATAVIQPGGSMRDAEVIAAADEHGIAMIFTGRRHFRH